MRKKLYITIDVEDDPTDILTLLPVLPKKATVILYVVADLLQKYKNIFLELERKGCIIGLHGYKHERFDDLSYIKKKQVLEKAMTLYKKTFKKQPRYFRAPQFSADFELITLLDEKGFTHDSSLTQLPIFQSLFFPTRFWHYTKQIRIPSKIKKHKLQIQEVPVSSCIFASSMFSLRIFPMWFVILLTKLSLLIRMEKEVVFLAHSYELHTNKQREQLKRYTNLITQ